MPRMPVIAVSAALLCSPLCAGENRFGRQVFKPADPARYKVSKVNDIGVPTLHAGKLAVKCLVYQDAERLYVEAAIVNDSEQDIVIARDFITLTEGGRNISRTDTVKAARSIEDHALQPFVPTPDGKNAASRAATYDRGSVAEQAKKHIAQQEREATFAALLISLAQEEADPVVRPGHERAVACTFEQRKNRKAPFDVTLHVGGEEFRFTFQE